MRDLSKFTPEQLAEIVFSVGTEYEFNEIAWDIFLFQYRYNAVYREFCDHLGKISDVSEIPYLPVEVYKSERVITGSSSWERVFQSSGTSGMEFSRHFLVSEAVYLKSFRSCFRIFFGEPAHQCILGLLPSYLEREGSSLVYMVDGLIRESSDTDSGFFLHDTRGLTGILRRKRDAGVPVVLFGVTFALLDLAEKNPIDFPSLIIIETGGMKGRREEMIREELHGLLKNAFGTERIYSEYGMTELLSQAYSMGDGIFSSPPWMKVKVRDLQDPITMLPEGRSGAINVIDLANVYSCSFLATQDIGKLHPGGGFEVLGRTDASDIRGCSLLFA
ncbi:MAG: acyl transferase [Bacteroidetes bacterium]|nr:acyl transferase [Bacteroidota bacterium]